METIKRLGLSEQAIQSLLHPHTGLPIEPLGHRKDGRAIWPILGASEDDDAEDEDDEDDTDDDDADDDEGKDDEGKDSNSGSGSDKDDEDLEGLKAKNRQLIQEKKDARERADKARQELDAVKKRLKDLESKDMPDADRLTRDLEEATTENEKLKARVQDADLRIAFLEDNTFEWHNPKHALASTDLSDVTIDDDGKVHGLADALKKTAEDYPYLLKSEGGDGTPKGKKTPPPPKNKGDQDKAKRQKEELEKKYPGLRR